MSEKSLAYTLIEEAIATQSKFLDLGNCGLTDNSPELEMLKECTFLEGLSLGSYYYDYKDILQKSKNKIAPNQLTIIPVFNIPFNIKKLSFCNNVIPNLSRNIEDLIQLESLDLSYNKIIKIENLENLTTLNSLDFSNNKIIKIENLEYLIKLKSLNLEHNLISKIENLDRINFIKILNLSKNKIHKIENLNSLENIEQLDLSGNKIGKIENLNFLLKLNTLILSENKITQVEGKIFPNSLKTLDLRFNSILKINEINSSDNLENLYLSQNKLFNLDFIENLDSLKILRLIGNRITNPVKLNSIIKNLNELHLSQNPLNVSFKDTNNIKVWKGYFDNLKATETKLVQNKYIKLNILGDGRIGKSQFVNYISEGKFEEDENPTEGMVSKFFKLPDSDIEVNLWDYGGQNYYHGTHQLFIRSQDANIVMWGNKCLQNNLDEPSRKYNYWLGTARNFSNAEDNPSLFLIQSVWSSENDKSELPYKIDIEDYAIDSNHIFSLDVKKTFEKDKIWEYKWDYFINILKLEIEGKLKPIDEKWMKVHKTILDENSDEIIYKKTAFFKKYADFVPEIQKITLLAYLEYAGSIIHFEKEVRLKDYIILKPDKLSNWIHKNITESDHKNGRIKKSELKTIFKKETDFFIDLMDYFQLIFKDNKSDESDPIFIIPQFLSDNNSAFKHALFDLVPYTFSLTYPDYFHEGKFFNFMSEYGQYASDETSYWKFGLMFKSKEKFNIQTIVYYDRINFTITVHIEDKKGRSEMAKELFEYFAYTQLENEFIDKDYKADDYFSIEVENDKLPSNVRLGYAQEKYEKYISTRKFHRNLELSTTKNIRINIAETKKNISAGNYIGLNKLNDQQIKLDFMTINLLDDSEKKKHRIFFSYSHKDEIYRDELEIHFANLKRSGMIETWHDRKILPGMDWDIEIEEQLLNADIVLLLVSPDFINSDYIWNRELELMKSERFNGRFVPIMLRPCDVKQISFMEQQGLPRDLKWIQSSHWFSRDEAYLEIVNGLRTILRNKESSDEIKQLELF